MLDTELDALARMTARGIGLPSARYRLGSSAGGPDELRVCDERASYEGATARCMKEALF